MRYLILLLAVWIAGTTQAMEAGFQTGIFTDTDRERPIHVDYWYPVINQVPEAFNYGLGKGRVVPAGVIAPGKFPLVVLSHGAMGAARNYSWLAESLARRGIIVAGISHYGESYVFGADTIDPASVLNSTARPLDVSATITYIERRSEFSSSVNLNKIGFIGHSSGGATAMHLAGVSFDRQLLAKYCTSTASKDDRGCDYAKLANISDAEKHSQVQGKIFTDVRVKTIVALDPALGPGFSDFSQISGALRFLIVGSVQNDFLPFNEHARRYAINLVNAEHHWLDRGEGHFVYLNKCSMTLEANGVPLCADRPNVTRSAVHDELKTVIYNFIKN